MHKFSKKTLIAVIFISIVTAFVFSSNNVFASEFAGREEEWTALCSTILSDEGTKAKCAEYRTYLMNLSKEKRNEAANAQAEIDAMQGDINKLAELSYQYSQNVEAINAEVAAINAVIAESDAALATLDVQIEEQTEIVDARMEVVLERMVDIQVTINTNEYINMIMGSEDLLTFVQKIKGIAIFTDIDNEAIEELNKAVLALEADKAEQVRIKEMQEVQKIALVDKQAQAEEIKAANDAVYAELVAQSATLTASRDASNAQANEVLTWIPTVVGHPGGSVANADFYGGWYEGGKNIFSPAYTGQCTWYVYGRVNEVTNGQYAGNLPTGDATNWVAQAQALGLQTGNTPRSHSIMVWASGIYGHVAYIESYDGSNIRASEGNVNAPGGGLPMYTDLETAIKYTMDATWSYSQYVATRGYPIGFIYL